MQTNEERVVEAAWGLFLKYGFSRVTIGDIAKEAGMSRPTLYQCFANKEEVFLALIGAFNTKCFERIEGVLDEGGDFAVMAVKIFEIWTFEPYAMLMGSQEGREFIHCTFDFAQEALNGAYEVVEVVCGAGDCGGWAAGREDGEWDGGEGGGTFVGIDNAWVEVECSRRCGFRANGTGVDWGGGEGLWVAWECFL